LLEEPATCGDDNRMVVNEKDFAHRGARCGQLASENEVFVSGPAIAAILRRRESGLDYCNSPAFRYRENLPIVPGQIPVAAIRASH